MNNPEFDIYTVLYGLLGLLFLVGIAVWYLNNARTDTPSKLMKLFDPFGLFLSTVNKHTFASGVIEQHWVVLNVLEQGRNRFLVKMRTKLELTTAPRFYLASLHSLSFLKAHSSQDVNSWPTHGGKFKVQILDNIEGVTPESLVEGLSEESMRLVAEFEEKFEGVLLYPVDNKLLPRLDKELLEAMPDLENELVLFTHFYVTKKASQQDFEYFVNESLLLAKDLQADIRAVVPQEDEENAKRVIKMKRNS